MLCPIDNAELVMSDRQGIEIDYCPKCRGVWLDRGELDKIIERSVPAEPVREERREEYRSDSHSQSRSHDGYGHNKPYRKKKSLLGELFDF
ncbi:zf-TFIIB domain-containing protein [Pseudochrobactrum sp. MP213Fo]|uniref:TFIIB-type zinc ribbon-containing protein n=1 Tax=Pseudochrobactrum sp. MP213Fo TaxID=3022250 RepID=UPI003BA0913D